MWKLATYFHFMSNSYNKTPNHSHHIMEDDGGQMVVNHGGLGAVPRLMTKSIKPLTKLIKLAFFIITSCPYSIIQDHYMLLQKREGKRVVLEVIGRLMAAVGGGSIHGCHTSRF